MWNDTQCSKRKWSSLIIQTASNQFKYSRNKKIPWRKKPGGTWKSWIQNHMLDGLAWPSQGSGGSEDGTQVGL